MPYVIAVCHQKGGVAKTTTVAALGAIFSQDKYRTLIVDLDPSANLTSSFGFSPAKIRRSAAEFLLGNDSILNLSQHTSLPGLDIVPSGPDMATVSRFLYLRPQFEALLQSSLAQSQAMPYHFVLLDCPPAVASLNTVALTAAHLALIPIQCEYYSLQALETMFRSIQSVRTRSNPHLCFRLMITMFDRRGTLHARVLQMVRQKYNHALFENVIGFDSRLRESQLAGLPITEFAPQSRSTQQYRALASELYAYVQKQSLQPTA